MEHSEGRALVVDGIIFSLQRHGGISVYAKQLLSRLDRDRVAARLALYEPLQQRRPAFSGLQVTSQPARPLERYRRCPLRQPAAVFHSTYYRRPSVRAMPTVVTVHDFTYERYATGMRRWVHSTQKFAAIRAAQAVICISQATRDDLLEWVGEQPGQTLHVVYNGVDEAFRPLFSEASSDPRFMLFVGQRGGYKNFALAVRALDLLPGLELVCVGGGPFREEELSAVTASVRQRIRHAGPVDDAALNRLYNRALCLVYPSRYEGFGIPVIEAMQAGCPVVSAPCRAVLEVGGEALTVAPADDPEALGHAVLSLEDGERRSAIIEAGFSVARRYSWETTYRQTLAVYRDLGLP